MDLKRSLAYAEQSLELAKNSGDQNGMAYAYRILGSIYASNEDYFMGMQYLDRARTIFEQDKDSIGLANCYISLGHIYRKLENRSREVEFHQKSYEFFKALGIRERLGVAAHNLGESYFLSGELGPAETLTDEAIAINSDIRNLPVLSNCLKVKGQIAMCRGNTEQALVFFNRILEISAELGPNSQKQAAAVAYLQLANISGNRGNLMDRQDYLLQAESLCKEYGLFSYLNQIYYQLTLHHMGLNQLDAARAYAEKEHQTAEAMHAKLVSDRSQLAEGMVHIDALNSKTNWLQSQTATKDMEIKNRNILLGIIGICVLLLLWFAWKTRNMYQRLQRKSQVILKQKAELETLNATKDKFFSMVAHDIRSPLNSLKSFTTLLTDSYDILSEADVKAMSKDLDRSIDSTLRMADNMILWATDQMKKTTEVHASFPLHEVIRDVYELFRDVAKQKQVNLIASLDQSLLMHGNRNQVEFIIRNLVNNAIKYTPRHGQVSLGILNENTDQVQVYVRDNGVGMSKEVLEELFILNPDKSKQGTEGEKGSGLGLMLSFEFARRNHGSIAVESTPGEGTAFNVRFRKQESLAA